MLPFRTAGIGNKDDKKKPQEIHARKIPLRVLKNMEHNGNMELKGLKHPVKEPQLSYLIRGF